MFELYQLRYFLAVVETGSFTKAAERVYVTQPTLSAGIAKLEGALGTRLFDRSNRRVSLTRAGNRLVERAKSILHECSLAESELADIEEPRILRLGALMTVPASITARLVREFTGENPDVSVELFDGTEQELLNRLDQSQIDIAITVLRGTGTPLFDEPYTLAIAADHAMAGQSVIGIEELADEPVIIRTRCEVLSETSRFFTDHNVRPPIAYRTDQDERALELIAAGIGVTTMPDCYRAPGVVRVRLQDFDYSRTVGLIEAPYPSGQDKRALIGRLLDFAAARDWPAIMALP